MQGAPKRRENRYTTKRMTMTKTEQAQYFIYARKSTEDEDRQVLSLDSQEKTLGELAARFGLKIVKIFRESHSAKAPDARPVFAEMIAQIRNGEARGIVCWKLDRLARNPDEAGRIIGMLQRKEILHIRTQEKDYYPEDNSLLSYLEFGIANQYIRDLSNNVKRGLATKLDMGWFPSRAPLGYINTINREKGRNVIIPDPDRFDQVKRMFMMHIAGTHSISQIHRIATDEWKFHGRDTKRWTAKPLSLSMVYKIFTSPFYYGWFEYPRNSGKWFKGQHQPMITKAEFDEAQRRLGRYEGKPRQKVNNFPYVGIMSCGRCGAGITAEQKWKHHKNGNSHHYIYYHCTRKKDAKCPWTFLAEKDLEEQIDGILKSFQISEAFKDWAIRFVKLPRENQENQVEESAKQKEKRIVEIGKQLEAMFLKYTSPVNADGSLISDDEYRKAKLKLEAEKRDLGENMTTADECEAELVELTEKTFNFACYARARFNEGSQNDRRAIFLSLGSNFVLTDGKLTIDLHFPWKAIAEKKNGVEREIMKVRTSEKSITTNQICDLSRKFLILRGQ